MVLAGFDLVDPLILWKKIRDVNVQRSRHLNLLKIGKLKKNLLVRLLACATMLINARFGFGSWLRVGKD